MKIKYILLTLSLLIIMSCNTVFDEEISAQNEEKEIMAEGIMLKWQIENEQINITLSASTTGWIAVGFDPSAQMLDANVIIGYVESSNTEIRDDFGDTPYTHSSDVSLGGTDNITNVSGSEEEGITELNFSIPLSSGDTFDSVLVEGSTYPVILATGLSDDFDSIHNVRTTVVIQL
jgi:hypothetical protein